jgi:glycerophosphoryl diester phosphodiesterase
MVVLASLGGTATAGTDLDCDQTPDTARWQDAGTPDEGLDPLRVTVHRGAAQLAPENTIAAFEYAIAYDMPMIEVDVQQTLDHRYVVFHDYNPITRTGQGRPIHTMTYDEVKAINIVGGGSLGNRWGGSEYDPSYMPDLEEVLQLASDHGVGINFDLKEDVYDASSVALLAAEYPGLIQNSIFQPYVPGRAEQIIAAVPEAQVMLNPQFTTPAHAFYIAGAEYDWFGSDLDWFTPEVIAAIHDACDLVQPNVYTDNKENEAAGILEAIRRGADGAMVNNPEVAADVLDRPVPTTIQVGVGTACLLGHDGLGLPDKPLSVDGIDTITRRGGCISLPDEWSSLSFAGDGSALGSSFQTQAV